ncbi:MAG TPA: TIGR02453 family protein, partial [Stellaceae bacterium]|nr:TIGR02453 family protein [Stellaceae bacterium]
MTGFTGFRPAAFGFFRGLARHNDPLWFKPRKSIYDTEVLAPFRALILLSSEKLEAAGIPLVGDPDRGIFRLYRDVRFSANKQLYKTHAGAVLTRSGGKGDPGLLYVHIEPGKSEAGVGFWHPEPALLTKLRRSIADDPDGFLDMVGRLDKRGYKVATDAQLARLPRGFEAAKGTPAADYICWK